MDTERFWGLIADARAQVPDPADAKAVADQASTLLAAYPVEEIVAAEQVFWDVMNGSHRTLLWAAAHLVQGWCSDDGFDYFRGWLIAQGREVHDRVVADPDSLVDVPVVATASGRLLECEEVLGIVWNAHIKATGEQLPRGPGLTRSPRPDIDFDFDDEAEMSRRLPRLAALYAD